MEKLWLQVSFKILKNLPILHIGVQDNIIGMRYGRSYHVNLNTQMFFISFVFPLPTSQFLFILLSLLKGSPIRDY